jgi:hypothetical protein
MSNARRLLERMYGPAPVEAPPRPATQPSTLPERPGTIPQPRRRQDPWRPRIAPGEKTRPKLMAQPDTSPDVAPRRSPGGPGRRHVDPYTDPYQPEIQPEISPEIEKSIPPDPLRRKRLDPWRPRIAPGEKTRPKLMASEATAEFMRINGLGEFLE